MLSFANSTRMLGRLVAAGRLQLDSWFEGDIVCSRLEIGPDGYVNGSIAAREVVVEGQVVGPIHASTVHLKSGAFVEGDIHHTSIKVDQGATITGRSARFRAIQLPAQLLRLEAEIAAEEAEITDIVDITNATPPPQVAVIDARQPLAVAGGRSRARTF